MGRAALLPAQPHRPVGAAAAPVGQRRATRRHDPPAHPGHVWSARAACDGQGDRRRPRHGRDRGALFATSARTSAAIRGRPLHQPEGKEALHDLAEQWRRGGSFLDETTLPRREAFNIMLSMPRGTDPLVVQRAAREFARAELSDHRYVMVLHDHQANPHVHISVRAESRHGERLNPRKADLQRWRETFAEKLRGWGIDAEATRQPRAPGPQLRADLARQGAARGAWRRAGVREIGRRFQEEPGSRHSGVASHHHWLARQKAPKTGSGRAG